MLVAANEGDAKGEAAVAVMLHDGIGTKQDFTKAIFWARESAKLGNRLGETELMQMYANGDGTPKNPAKAEELRQFMAQQNIDAMWNELLHGNSQTAQLGRMVLGAMVAIWQEEPSSKCIGPRDFQTMGCPGFRSSWAK